MNSIPAEILVEIFENCSIGLLCNWRDPCGPRSNISVLKVCRLWREIALSSPSLWDTISIEDFGVGHKRHPSSTSIARHLALSGVRPLVVTLRYSKVPVEFGSGGHMPSYRLIIDEIHRWKIAEIYHTHWRDYEYFVEKLALGTNLVHTWSLQG